MLTIIKVMVFAVIISALIKYSLPDLTQLSLIDQERIAIGILAGVPGIFLTILWRRFP